MNLQDGTKNQHFIPRVEQRLNALNPLASDENKKIYEFTLNDRESYSIKLKSNNGVKINNSLSLIDLFSFEVLGKGAERYNFEKLFHRYESNIKYNTESIIKKLSISGSDIKPEILNIFASKFFNFIRNPYSVKKVLNSFPSITNFRPTDPVHLSNFEKVLKGKKPQQKYLCNELEISEEEYVTWLSVIFLLATPLVESDQNLLDQIIKDLYENPETFISAYIYTYDDKTCLLSDRGYSIPLPEDDHMAWDFNLCSNSFIRYIFGSIDKLAPIDTPKKIIDSFKNGKKTIKVHWEHNDLEALEQYNKHVVYQCFNTVFNSSIECYGL